jgi:hypothetical protein
MIKTEERAEMELREGFCPGGGSYIHDKVSKKNDLGCTHASADRMGDYSITGTSGFSNLPICT